MPSELLVPFHWDVPQPPPIPRIQSPTLLRRSLFILRRWLPGVLGLLLVVALAVVVGPHLHAPLRIAGYWTLLLLVVTAAASVCSYQEWVHDARLASVFSQDKNILHYLERSGPDEIWPQLARGVRVGAVPQLLLSLSQNPACQQFEGDMRRVSMDPDSPWMHHSELRSFLEQIDQLYKALIAFEKLANALQSVDEFALRRVKKQIENLVDAHPLICELYEAICQRIAHIEDERRKNEEAEQKRIDNEKQRTRVLADQTVAIKENNSLMAKQNAIAKSANAAQKLEKERTRVLDTVDRLHSKFETEINGFVLLQEAVRELRGRSHEGVAREISQWQSQIARLTNESDKLRRLGSTATTYDELRQCESQKTALEDEYTELCKTYVQLQGLRADGREETFRNHHPDVPTAITAFLRHLDDVARQSPIFAEVWRMLDKDGNIWLYYYGPQRHDRVKSHNVFAKVSFAPTSVASLRMEINTYIPFNLVGDLSLYRRELAVGNLPQGNTSSTVVTFNFMSTRTERRTKSRNDFEEHTDRNSHRVSKKTTDSDIEGQRIEAEKSTINETNHQDSRKNQNNSPSSHTRLDEESLKNRSASTERDSREKINRTDTVELDESGHEDVYGRKEGTLGERVYETQRRTEFVEVTIDWDPSRLLKSWEQHEDNKESATVHKLLLDVFTQSRPAVEKSLKDSRQGLRLPGQPTRPSGQLDEDFWQEAGQFALLQREFDHWPFAVVRVPYSNVPRARIELPDSSAPVTSRRPR